MKKVVYQGSAKSQSDLSLDLQSMVPGGLGFCRLAFSTEMFRRARQSPQTTMKQLFAKARF